MMEIEVSCEPEELETAEENEATVRRVVAKVGELYGLGDAEVSVTFTNDENIRRYNAQYRNIDRATDVLSFPMREGDEPEIVDGPEAEMLGDIVISLETARRQAVEYGHSLEREVAFLTVHSMLHLLGYDHIEEADRSEMRREEEFVLDKLGISRD